MEQRDYAPLIGLFFVLLVACIIGGGIICGKHNAQHNSIGGRESIMKVSGGKGNG